MAHQKAADLLVKTLEEVGVKHLYGITGDSANFITDAIARSTIRFIHTRHEEAAALAATAEATATGKLAVCLGSCGPGSLHLVNGLYEANRNGVPLLALVTEIHTSQIGTRFIQEIDTQSVFRGCSQYCEYVRSAEQLPHILGIAMQTAISKKGVGVVIITGEVSSELIENEIMPSYLPFYTYERVTPSEEELDKLMETLNTSPNLTIYGGAGCSGAEKEVKKLSALLHAPLVWTYRSKELFDYDNPHPVGMAGILGNSAADYALHHCDTLLLLGCGFAFTALYPDHVRIVQVDIAGDNLSRRHSLSLGLVGDIKSTVSALLEKLEQRSDTSFADTCVRKYRKAQEHLMKLTKQDLDSKHPIYPENLTALLNRKIAPDAWITADVGTPWAFAGRYMESLGGRHFCCSSLHGTMAAAMPFTIGLAVAAPEKQVVALCGDGGLSMLLGDLLTIKQEKLKPKLFVFNNSSLDFVAMEMKADGLLDSYTYLENPNFADVAKAMGIKGIRVNSVAELEAAVDEALSYDGAVLVDVVVDGLSMLVPPKITVEMVEKYSHYVSKMVFTGKTEELLVEALTNLRGL